MKKGIFFSIILVGFTGVIAQVILMREFLVVFYGNEISIGFIFAAWFIGGMLGSWFLGRLADTLKAKTDIFSFCQFLLSILVPLSVLAVRSIKPVLNLDPGEVMGILPMFLSSLVILIPICAVLGFMFSLGSRIYNGVRRTAYANIGMVYVLEAIGAMAGGLLVSFILVRAFNSFQIAAILSLLNISGAILLQILSREKKAKPVFIAIFLVSFMALLFLWLSSGLNKLEQRSLKMQWKGYELLASKNSIYGNIAATESRSQRSFFYNGLRLYTIPDQLAAEEAVHFALLEHSNPEAVLLIGGGSGELVGEILKHPVKKLDYVELDPMIIEMAKEYLPGEKCGFLKDSRVTIKNVDGRLFVKSTKNKYDCVIVHLGDPHTAQLNRYYTVEFFKEVKNILTEGGIISFALSSSESYLSRELKDFLRSIYSSLKEVFLDVKVIPGDTAYFLACDKDKTLTYDYKTLAARTKERNIDIKYVREYYLFSKLSPEKVIFTEESMRPDKSVKINYDFQPVSYYYGMIFWAAHFRDSFFKKMLESVTADKIRNSVYVLCGLILLFGIIRIGKKKKLEREASIIAVAVTGFTQMVLQIIILLSFQIIYGYVFYKLGLIITCFMAGLALGSLWIMRILPKMKKDLAFFIWIQLGICIYSITLPVILRCLSSASSSAAFSYGAEALFPLLPIIAGFIGGAQFPLVNKIYMNKKEEIGRVAGLSYGMDLLGSCVGAFLASIFLIPILGIAATCWMIALVNLAVLILLIR
ncbi:MAG: hypothetical protein COS99_05290 [Candidatus Omnitrophica bacterium CG07_land_8_20_14_0_80_42_15]|uniref:Polyamine aminopropyltransferase n=1 Tax=Candidatus Aquitaenariimonas noxiae TaxID=1974741 RepID=A0A2J0KSE4_9BACT|nr:MAG: hypothetical protein COS99_05290 [Candidatus Omnitrophica bacterium CG07_land_8_20_14_0_80_42_15]